MVDSLGLLLWVWVHPASLQDRIAGGPFLEEALPRFPTVQLVKGDGASIGPAERAAEGLQVEIEIAKKEKTPGFTLAKGRWVVERTFAWLVKCRRLRWDYEATVASSLAWIYLAMIGNMVRRLART